MNDEMRAYFDRLIAAWEAAGEGLPRVPWDPDADPLLWQSEPDENEYVTWRPLPKTERHDVAAAAPDLAPLHPSLDAYFNAWWFAALEGRLGDYGITLLPVLPGRELDTFLAQARGYAEAHDGRLDHVPIGIEFDGLQVVVDNRTGEVAIEDWERGTFTVIAAGLEDLIARLEP